MFPHKPGTHLQITSTPRVTSRTPHHAQLPDHTPRHHAQLPHPTTTTTTTMVRYKARYLLFNILYPTASSPTSSTSSTSPSPLDFHSPTTAGVTPGDLATLLRESILQNFGDWGSACAGNLSGTRTSEDSPPLPSPPSPQELTQ
jgi:hypothetical protein